MTKQKIRTVYESIEPDNVNFPKGLSMKTRLESDALFFDFECSKDRTASLAPTIDEVLGHVQTALEVIK
ncbi:MAG: hypothetical protein K8823_434 [Cenarchaeum symbiont of Oopsacas minuta]|nr:hypothetical protein [Cenarchaeum symbiont of Oopsacas minuta]